MPGALVVGGTGPTGPHVVNGLIERGYEVTILHTGRHEIDEIPPTVEHIHTDPFDGPETDAALGERKFSLIVAMYGRLRTLAPILSARTKKLITIGGVGATRGWVDPRDLTPTGMTVPAPPNAPLAGKDEPIGKIRRIVETEQTVFAHHPQAIHLRYPMLYGPRQIVPREWPLVRRARDRRRLLVLPDGGLTLSSAAYVANAAHAVLCAVDGYERGAGNIYNVVDSRALTLAQVAELVAEALNHEFEVVSMPAALAVPARPLLRHWSSGHRVVNAQALKDDLGYADVVKPEDAVRSTAQWLEQNPPTADAEERLQDPFDYDAEDLLIERWRHAIAGITIPTFRSEPGFGAAYYGRDPNPATGTSRVEPVA